MPGVAGVFLHALVALAAPLQSIVTPHPVRELAGAEDEMLTALASRAPMETNLTALAEICR